MSSSFTIMKRLFLSALLVAFFVSGTFAQVGNYKYSDAWGKQGLSVKEQKSEYLNVNFSIDKFAIKQAQINNRGYHTISLPNNFLPGDAGMPDLPGNGRYIAIPNGATVEYEIVNSRKEVFQNVSVAPAPVIPLDTDKSPLKYEEKEEIYNTDAFYPESPVVLSDIKNIRGVQTAMLGITPFQYNPVTKELIVYRDLEVRVKFNGGDGKYGEDRLRSRWWDPIIKGSILNADVISDMDYSKREMNQNKSAEECEYLIIVPNDPVYAKWADSIKLFRTQQGITTNVVSLDEIGGATINDIEGYIDDIYDNWTYPPAAVLLMADYGSNPDNSITSPIYDDYCVADNIYADVDDDHLPDIVFARMTAQNEEQLETMVTKFINYETNPPSKRDFYDHPITALGWQTERWFQVCSESIGGFWKNELGKHPVRINEVYDGNPNGNVWSTAANSDAVIDYFGPNGVGYIPASPAELGDWEGGNAADVTKAINDGAFMLQHRDHGGEDGWGEPNFRNGDIETLTNTDLTYILSINCLTGKFNHTEECFTEKFHRHTNNGVNAGALGVMAATEVSYSFVNDTYVWGVYDYMWPEFMPDYVDEFPGYRGILPGFAMVYGKYFLDQSDWPSNPDRKELTNNLFHHHGDAFLNVYSEVPQDLDVAHNDIHILGQDNFEVSAEEGSLVALSLNGELLSVGNGSGDFEQLAVSGLSAGDYIDVVVTKQNYYRYHAKVLVVETPAACVVKDTYLLKDITGNNNGVVEFNETVDMDLAIKNLVEGTVSDVQVSISSNSDLITIIDNNEDYGDVSSDNSVLIEDAYQFVVKDGIPDQAEVNMTIKATDGTDEWLSYLNFRLCAPVLKVASMTSEEIEGDGDGLLEPGEKAKLTFISTNKGHSVVSDLTSTLNVVSPFIQIEESVINIDEIGINGETSTEFIISIADNTPNGTGVFLQNTVVSGKYSSTANFSIKVGAVMEDWETGDLTKFDWINDAANPWVIVEDYVYEGTYSLQSGFIDHSQETILSIEIDCVVDDTISFVRKISSEGSFDLLEFFVDDQKRGAWSGEKDWERVAFYVPAGNHTFSWKYRKDYTGTDGKDRCWIDNITFPATTTPTLWAGNNHMACEGSAVELNGTQQMMESVSWTTSGTGSFANATQATTSYTPSQEDLDNGSVILTLSGTFEGDQEVSHPMTITFVSAPTIETETEIAICGLEPVVNLEASIENYSTVLWSTTGDGSFYDATALETTYIPGVEDIAAGECDFILNVSGLGTCDPVEMNIHAGFFAAPTAVFTEESLTYCESENVQIPVTLSGLAPWTLTVQSTISDVEEEYTIDSENWMMEFEATENHTVNMISLSDFNGCFVDLEGAIDLVVNPLPVAALDFTGTDLVDLGLVDTSYYTASEIEFADSYQWILDPADAGELIQDGLDLAVVWNDAYNQQTVTLTLQGQNDCGMGQSSEKSITISDNTGENEYGITSFMMYPNPADSKVRIKLSLEKQQNLDIRLVNNLGSVILFQKVINTELVNTELSVDHLASGVYYVIVNGDNVNAVRKLVVK